MAGSKQPQAKGVSSTDKENHPPKKSNRTISVGSLFAQKHVQRKDSETEGGGVLAPRPAGIMKPAANHARFATQSRRSKQAENHPLFRSFAESVGGYRKGVTDNIEQQLEPVCKELLARVDGFAIHGQPLPGVDKLSGADIAELVTRGARLSRPLEEETMTIQSRRKDGTYKAVDISLGTMIQNFETLLEETRAKVKTLRTNLHEIDIEKSAAYQDILDTENGDGKTARRELEADLDALANEASEAKEQTLADIKQAREEEKSSAEEERQKLNALLNT